MLGIRCMTQWLTPCICRAVLLQMQRRFVPWYDERFKGYNKNKVRGRGCVPCPAASGVAQMLVLGAAACDLTSQMDCRSNISFPQLWSPRGGAHCLPCPALFPYHSAVARPEHARVL